MSGFESSHRIASTVSLELRPGYQVDFGKCGFPEPEALLRYNDVQRVEPVLDTVEKIAEWLWNGEVKLPRLRPRATYRLQLHQHFNLEAVTALVPYLDALGISDCYLSPYLMARPGSSHGYDIIDHSRINPEIGDDAADARLREVLREHDMGRVLDVVPNHMGIAGPNAYWLDVLENGPHAPSARFFDIDWHPVKDELHNRMLLPILEDQYGRVLEEGKISLDRDNGSFFVRYQDVRLPLAPRSYAIVLDHGTAVLHERLSPEDPKLLEYESIRFLARNLPDSDESDPDQIEHALREKEVMKHRLGRLSEESPEVRDALDAAVQSFSGKPGDPASYDALHELLEAQAYRLAFWRVAGEEINYRRFFDVTDLAGLRTEDPVVFEAVHRAVLSWVNEGGITGLRIDHPDGLADPVGYFQRLQETILLGACRRRFEQEAYGQDETSTWKDVTEQLLSFYRSELEANPASPRARYFPIVAEKILSGGEELPGNWPIDGTVGYGFLNALNGLFVDSQAAPALRRTYAEFTEDHVPFADVLYEAKELITRATLASEVNTLANRLNELSERDRRTRDFTLNTLRRALREVIACFPIYRTYVRPGETVSDRDRVYIARAIHHARRRNPTMDRSIFDFVQSILLLEYPPETSEAERAEREAFVVRFQQTTGPVQAKGLEDTAFYRQYPLSSLNEVGADPNRFGSTPAMFHAVNARRLARWPGGLLTTSTHDTKRGEDTRIRINVISELADDWTTHLARWTTGNTEKRIDVHGILAPDAREEYLLYQTLLGVWPWAENDVATAPPAGFVARIQNYMVKAAREAKLNTSWTDPDPSYTQALERFVAEVLEGQDASKFLDGFVPFARRVARVGVVHSLSQTLLKLASPGIPDIYQGSELWDLRLVDPDNREPVDYPRRQGLLEMIQRRLSSGSVRAELARSLFERPEDGAIKFYVIASALAHRRADPDLYSIGTYEPLEADGPHKDRLVGFLRVHGRRSVLALAPRLVSSLMGPEATTPPVGLEVWDNTLVFLPEVARQYRWHDLLTDTPVPIREREGRPGLLVGETIRHLPVALLVAELH
jgi:(1->4)-alpha-D-glucan 1-alpha-D-glucosylmutase